MGTQGEAKPNDDIAPIVKIIDMKAPSLSDIIWVISIPHKTSLTEMLVGCSKGHPELLLGGRIEYEPPTTY